MKKRIGLLLLAGGLSAGLLRGASCLLPLLPQNSYRVSSSFGMRVHPISGETRMHKGVDLACPLHTPVFVVSGGVVIFAGRSGCFGNVVVVRHPGGWVTLYGHLSRIAPGLRPGVRVRGNQIIALSGASGCVTGPHLHFEVWREGRPVNPLLVCVTEVKD